MLTERATEAPRPSGATRASGILAVVAMAVAGLALGATGCTDDPTRNPPQAQSAQLSTAEDTVLTGQLVATDPDGDPLSFSVVDEPLAGVLELSPDGSFTYTPDPDYWGPDDFSFTVTDGFFYADVTWVDIDITAVNDAPVITGQQPLTVASGVPFTLALSHLTVTDSDNSYPTDFTLTVNSGTNYTVSGATITPAANISGTLTVPVFVNDGSADSNVFNLAVTVTGGNVAPVITGQSALSTAEDTPLTITLGNLTVADPDSPYPTGFTLTVGAGANYTVAGATITPSANFWGTLTVPVTVNDGTGDSNTFDLAVTVTPVNDAPVITGQQPLVTPEDTPLGVTLAHLTVIDPDNSYPTGFSLALGAGANYTVAGATITPAANFSGTLTVPVTVNDGLSDSNVFSLTITVNAVNDLPVITAQSTLTTPEDTPLTVTLANLTVTDADNSYPTGFSLALGAGANYTVAGATVTPAANFSGSLTVPVTVNDGTSDSPPFNLTITVGAVNDAPVITGQTVLTTQEDTPLGVTLANLQVTDPDDSYPADFTLSLGAGANYTVNGSTITPAANFHGTLTVPATVNDGDSDSNTFNLSVTVTSVNDLPVITAQRPLGTLEDTPLTVVLADLTVTDADDSYPTGFTLALGSGANYTVAGATITPATNFTGTLTVPVTVNDGKGDSAPFNLTVTVTTSNDAPVITGQNPVSTNEDTAVTITLADLTVTDPDNTYPTDFSLSVGDGANYTRSGATITPALNFSGSLTVPVTVNDGIDDSGSFNLTVTVTPVNDKPVITGQQTLTTAEDMALTVTLADLTVTDVDNTYPTGFSLSLAAGANYTVNGAIITPATNFAGTLIVPVTVNDGAADSDPFNLTVTVTTDNDTPVITGQNAVSTNEDTAVTITLADLTVTDPDNAYPADFTLSVGDGANYTRSGATIAPALNFNGTLTVPVTVSDGTTSSASFNLMVTVNPVNDPPVAGPDSYATVGNTLLTVAAGTGVLANDSDVESSFSIDSFQATSDEGGTVTLDQGTGAFTFLPKAGFAGTDKFTYALKDTGGATATGTVTVTVGPTMVWYVNASAATDGDGRSGSPFNSLASAAGASAAGHTIFVAGAAGAGLAAGIQLKGNQNLIGEGAGLTVAPNVTIPAGTAPVLTGTGITLANGNTVSGLVVDGTSGSALSGTGISGMTVTGVTIRNAPGPAVNLPNSIGNLTLKDVTLSSIAGDAISLGPTGGTSTLTLDNVTVSGTTSSGDGVSVQASAGGSTHLTLNVLGSSFTGIDGAGDAVNAAITGSGGGSLTVTVRNSQFHNVPGKGDNGIRVTAAGAGATTTVAITGNSLRDWNGPPISIEAGADGSTLTGTIMGNTIGDPANGTVVGSVSGSGIHLLMDAELGATSMDAVVAITGNTIANVGNFGIFASTREGTGTNASNALDVLVESNTLVNLSRAFEGVFIRSRHNTKICAVVSGNNSSNPGTGNAFRLQQSDGSTFDLEGTAATAQAQVEATNTGTTVNADAAIGVVAAATCRRVPVAP